MNGATVPGGVSRLNGMEHGVSGPCQACPGVYPGAMKSWLTHLVLLAAFLTLGSPTAPMGPPASMESMSSMPTMAHCANQAPIAAQDHTLHTQAKGSCPSPMDPCDEACFRACHTLLPPFLPSVALLSGPLPLVSPVRQQPSPRWPARVELRPPITLI